MKKHHPFPTVGGAYRWTGKKLVSDVPEPIKPACPSKGKKPAAAPTPTSSPKES